MDERDFLAELYQMWAKTPGAEDRYWMPEEYTDQSGRFNIYAVGQDETRKLVASSVSDETADFITALHGSFPDIYRRVLEAYDEADRLDGERDRQENLIAEMAIEIQELREQLGRQEDSR